MTRAPRRWYLLRGLGRESRHWFTFADHFASVTGAEVLPLDLPGTGARANQPSPSSVEAIASTLPIASGNHAVGILGISFGGMVALAAANSLRDSVSHVVVINSSSRLSPPSARFKPVGMLRFVQALAQVDDRQREELIYALTVNGSAATIRRYAEQAAAIAASARVSRLTAVRQLFAATRYVPRVPPARCLAIASAQDRLVDPACSATLAAHLSCPLLVHPTGGHDLPAEDPLWIASRVQRWIWTAEACAAKPAAERIAPGEAQESRTR